MHHQVLVTDTPFGEGSLQYLEVRHRGHARVEDRIRSGKTTGFGRFPSRHFQINTAWLELALTAIDPLAWTQTLLLDGELATADPKKLRYRLLHTAARLTRTGRRLHLRISTTWPWRNELTRAFARLAALPRPATRPAAPSLSAHDPRNPGSTRPKRRAKATPTRRQTATTTARVRSAQLSPPQPKGRG